MANSDLQNAIERITEQRDDMQRRIEEARMPNAPDVSGTTWHNWLGQIEALDFALDILREKKQ